MNITEIEVAGGNPPLSTLLHKLPNLLSEEELKGGLDFPDTKKGEVIETQPNIIHALKRFQVSVRHDDFSSKTYVRGVPGHTVLNDAAFDDIFIALDFVGLRVTKTFLWAFLRSHSRNKRVHPVRQLMDELEGKWDGIPRIDHWLTDYCGVDNTRYTRAIGSKWLIAAVRRVRQPGCKFENVLIFEGPQGIGKSTVFRVLAYDVWFTDNLTIGLDAKEVIELSRGKWICELAELSNIGKRDVESVKTFISKQTDESRMAYASETSEVHRQFVLAATTNRATYLRDESGNRRFWMVETKGVLNDQTDLPPMLDAPGIEAIRDQLWGEAAVREAQGEDIHLEPEIEALARLEQHKRFDIDDRQQLLEDYVEGKSGFLPNAEIYTAMGWTERKDQHRGNTTLIGAAMKRLGWEHDRQGVGKPSKQVRGWRSPGHSEDVLRFCPDSGMVAMARDLYAKSEV